MIDLTKVTKEKLQPEPVCPCCKKLNKSVKWAVVEFTNTLTGKTTFEAVCMPCVKNNGWR